MQKQTGLQDLELYLSHVDILELLFDERFWICRSVHLRLWLKTTGASWLAFGPPEFSQAWARRFMGIELLDLWTKGVGAYSVGVCM